MQQPLCSRLRQGYLRCPFLASAKDKFALALCSRLRQGYLRFPSPCLGRVQVCTCPLLSAASGIIGAAKLVRGTRTEPPNSPPPGLLGGTPKLGVKRSIMIYGGKEREERCSNPLRLLQQPPSRPMNWVLSLVKQWKQPLHSTVPLPPIRRPQEAWGPQAKNPHRPPQRER